MCTGIRLIAQDGTVVHARTMEFGIDLHSEILVIPSGYDRVGTAPETATTTQPGARWKTKYASVGANGFGMNIIADGLNSEGLAAGLFYFPTSAGYMPYSPEDVSKTIAPWELASWILEQHKSVNEVKQNIGNIVVAEVYLKEMGFTPPVHCVVHDAAGNSIVIEYVGGKLNIHDNPLGVMSNSPTFDWHMTNLRNYVNFSLTNFPSLKLNVPQTNPNSINALIFKPLELHPFGQGTGMLGMPGDFTPPSRFVRAVAFTQSILPTLLETGHDAVVQAFHILNNFDIPKGVAREQELHDDKVAADYTLWTSANDLKNKRFYFRTYNNSQIRVVDLMAMDLRASQIARILMEQPDEQEVFQTITPLLTGV